MLEKPEFPETRIAACARDVYGLDVSQVAFLPLGADGHTAVYRLLTTNHTPYFLKLRHNDGFTPTAVTLPKFLHDQGITAIIPPLPILSGQLWASLDPFKVILYPFVNGRNGYEVKLSPQQWREFGAALKQIHTTRLPPPLRRAIHQESYSPKWRNMVKRFLARTADNDFVDDPIATKVTALLQARQSEISDLVWRAERLAQTLQAQPPPTVLCHSDVHAGNVLLDDSGLFYIVDWDDPILAPKERDLMFIGGAQGFIGYSARAEETLFYPGYGETDIDPLALAYYRYERVVVDIAAYCEQLLLSSAGGEDRLQSFTYLASNFLPNNTIETAYHADKTR